MEKTKTEKPVGMLLFWDWMEKNEYGYREEIEGEMMLCAKSLPILPACLLALIMGSRPR